MNSLNLLNFDKFITWRLSCFQESLRLQLAFQSMSLDPPPSPPDPLGVCLPCAVPMMTPVCDCAAEVIGTAFFDVEMDALDYSVEDDGSLNLSERPYLQVCFTSVCLIRQPCQPGVWSQDLWRVREGGF